MSEQPLTYDWVAGKPKAVPADKLPPKEYMKGNLHIVDLSKCVDPYTESRRCNLWRFNTGRSVAVSGVTGIIPPLRHAICGLCPAPRGKGS